MVTRAIDAGYTSILNKAIVLTLNFKPSITS